MPNCRGCGGSLPPPFLDLGLTPLANSNIPPREAGGERRYPLATAFCPACYLVQIPHVVLPEEIFSDYVYFSSYSESLLKHSEAAVEDYIHRFGLTSESTVLEIASNDGYLLQYFINRGIRVLGVEPAANIAAVAAARGIPTLNSFFGPDSTKAIMEKAGPADLIIGNNVLAHVPEINRFLSAVRDCLSAGGHAAFEFPYVRDLIEYTEFDTIYHEHVFYYSLSAVNILAKRAGLRLTDVLRTDIHGGSLRVFLQSGGNDEPPGLAVQQMLSEEADAGLTAPEYYERFSEKVQSLAATLRGSLRRLKQQGYRLAAYGAPAKGNTLLNFCGIGTDLLDFTVDRNPAKQGLLTPGAHLPIRALEALLQERPDFALILPWNIADEVIAQQKAYLAAGGKFMIPIPHLRFVPGDHATGE